MSDPERRRVCAECFEHYKKKLGKGWGSRSCVKIPACSECRSRHLDEVRRLNAENAALQLSLDALQKENDDIKLSSERLLRFEAGMSASEHDSIAQKNKYDQRMSQLECDLTLLKETFDTRASELERDSIAQKKEYDQRVSELERNLTLEKETFGKRLSNLKSDLTLQVDTLKVANDRQRRQLEFLKLKRGFWTEDVLLETPDLHILANQNILAQKSPMFRQILQIANQPPAVVRVEGISSPVLEAIVDFCYSGEISFSETVCPDEILKLAHSFELWLLKEACEAELCRVLTVDNTPEMFKLARKFSALELQKETAKLLKENYDMLFDKVFAVWEARDSDTADSELRTVVIQG